MVTNSATNLFYSLFYHRSQSCLPQPFRGHLTGRELYLAVMCSPALRLERKQAYARERAIKSGQLKVYAPRKPVPVRSREIWHISPLLNSSGTPAPDGAVSYCLHPHTGHPFVVNGSCLVYDGDGHFRMVQYTDGKSSDWAKQPNIIDGEAHLACDSGTLVAIYRNGKCVSSSFVSLVTSKGANFLKNYSNHSPCVNRGSHE